MKRIDVYPASREDVETRRLLVRRPHVLISIRDPGTPKPKLPYNGMRLDVLSLEFDDAEPASNLAIPPTVRLMAQEDAEAIWSFVLAHLEKIDAVLVHCEQGMSRSPAVAAALMIGLGLDARTLLERCQPNAHVLELTLRAIKNRALGT